MYLFLITDEEECLSPSANDADWPYGSRRLLRFSTRVWNRGKADFKPAKTKNQWVWHQCHQYVLFKMLEFVRVVFFFFIFV